MRCVVTGVAGFVGSHLAERLLNDGHEVCGVDSFTDYYPRRIKERNIELLRASQNFSFIEADLLWMPLAPLLDGVDWIFHQAAQAGVRASWGSEFSHYVDWNVLATQQLLEAAKQVQTLKRFVYASSSSVYGDIDTFPVTETATTRPYSPYGVTKLAAEHLCSLYYHNFGLPTVSLRYFTVYGPRQRPDMAFHRFCKAALEHEPIRIYGDGQQTRDFTYISDIVEANVLAASVKAAVGQVFNIAGGARVSLHNVIQLLREVSSTPLIVLSGDRQYGDVRHTYADISLAEKLLGYRPQIPLQVGLTHEFEDIETLYRTLSVRRLATVRA